MFGMHRLGKFSFLHANFQLERRHLFSNDMECLRQNHVFIEFFQPKSIWAIFFSNFNYQTFTRVHTANVMKLSIIQRDYGSLAKFSATFLSTMQTAKNWCRMNWHFTAGSNTSTLSSSWNHLKTAKTFTWFNRSARITHWNICKNCAPPSSSMNVAILSARY